MAYCIVKTRWGYCAFVAGDHGLVATFLPDGSRAAIRQLVKQRYRESQENAGLLPKLAEALYAHFEGQPTRFNVRLDLGAVTGFRRRVLQACRRIPRGRTATYADLARAVGSPKAARAVGSALAGNPLPLVVPCHRVVRSDGALGGFSSPQGVQQKRRLLQLEGALPM